MRLIDADALLKHECEADRMGAMLVVGKGYILDAPTIDAVPVVRGEWVKEKENMPCSNCGLGGVDYWNYCPNCGADMRGNEG